MEEKKLKLAIVSGGFDPLHIGHLELFERAKSLADDLFVIVNTDDFLIRKKGKPFMPLEERMYIIQALKPVKFTIKSIDTDDTVCETLKFVYENYKVTKKYNKLFFCNGGDRTSGANTPEHNVCKEIGIQSVYGLGKKIQSSSWLTNG
jgi:cytidyltransferase-like protein